MTRVQLSGRVYDKQVGGNTRYVRAVYSGLEQHGIDVTIARPPGAQLPGPARSAAYAAFESVIWPLTSRASADVLHFPADTGAVVRGRTPIVGTIHGLATLHMEAVRSGMADRLWRDRVARLASVSDRIVTVSESSARDIAKFAPIAAKKLTVIHHGIDHDRFTTVRSTESLLALEPLDLPERYFLYVGNLDPRKNVVSLINAAREVFERTGVPLVISGAPAWDADEILALAKSTAGVRYLGRVDDAALVPLMQNALAFCFPSTYEGFGFPVLEAMACGTPVICSDRGSLHEVASDAALVLNDIGPVAIKDAMLEVENDEALRVELRDRGVANAARFSWAKSISAHAELFKEVAS